MKGGEVGGGRERSHEATLSLSPSFRLRQWEARNVAACTGCRVRAGTPADELLQWCGVRCAVRGVVHGAVLAERALLTSTVLP